MGMFFSCSRVVDVLHRAVGFFLSKDGFCGKLPGVLVLPVICVILCLVLALLLKRFMSENIRLFLSVLLVAPLLSVGLQFMILSNALGAQVNATAVSILIVGIFCIPI